jgi:hypothetical protein
MDPKESRSKTTPTQTGVRVSAIVVTYFTGEPLELCLRSLFAEPLVDEVVIVDNGNPKHVQSALRALKADRRNMRLVQGQGNVGFARACNLGAAAAQGEYLLFLNPDAVIQRGAAEKLLATGRMATSPWIVGGRLLDQDGREQRGARREILTPWRAFVGITGLNRLEKVSGLFRDVHRERDPIPERAIPVPVVSGAMMMMAKADFLAIDGFDEEYFLHVEDIDICRRAGELGGSVMFEPEAEATHYGGSSKASWLKVEGHKARGLARYFAKFARSPGEKVAVAILTPFLGMALMMRGLVRGVVGKKR